MNASRLNKLAALTRGAAVVGIGLAGSACSKQGEPPQPPTINAPPTPTTSVATDPSSAPVAEEDAALPVRRFPIPNAMPPRFRATDGGDGG
jgi:hypothetical protein